MLLTILVLQVSHKVNSHVSHIREICHVHGTLLLVYLQLVTVDLVKMVLRVTAGTTSTT
jgi:hypothetical protein